MPDTPLRVLILDPHTDGGGQVSYITRLATELTQRGCDVTLGCRPQSVLVQSAALAGCAAHNRFHFARGLRLGPWRADIREMRRYLRTTPPDLVHVNGSQDHWVAALAGKLEGFPVPLLRTRHNTYPVKPGYVNRLLNRDWTDFQIVVCDVVRRSLGSQSAFDLQRMCTIHNGVDAEEYRPDPAARASARAEFGFADTDLVCGIAARLVPAKGHEYLFRAVAQLKNSFPELRVLALGQGVLEAPLKALAEELGIGPRIVWGGFRTDMARCVQAFDIGVQPSVDCDTSSFSLKEQMAAEKPVVASDYGGLTEIVSDGVEGIVVPAGQAGPLASALRRLLSEPESRAQMGKGGRRRVLREFTLEVFAEKTLAAYDRAIQAHRTRRGRTP
jgi:glycosyltransferase involved in cell wall biosynthesis